MGVEGTWYNELGSCIEISVNGTSISGKYHTAVGTAEGCYDLVGNIDTDGDPDSRGQAIAWVVLWKNDYLNSHSVTAWSGQYQVINGVEEIETLWLLTSEEESENDWKATLVNKDIFTREKPSEESIAIARRKKMPSHCTC